MVTTDFSLEYTWLGSEGIKQQLSLQLNIEDERLLTKIGFNNCTFGVQTHSWIKLGREIYRDTVYHCITITAKPNVGCAVSTVRAAALSAQLHHHTPAWLPVVTWPTPPSPSSSAYSLSPSYLTDSIPSLLCPNKVINTFSGFLYALFLRGGTLDLGSERLTDRVG